MAWRHGVVLAMVLSADALLSASRSVSRGLRCRAAAAVSPPAASASLRRELYPLADVLNSGMLEVGDGHELYFEVRGNRADAPLALFLHGGPGAGCFTTHARFFDPAEWRVCLLDQRGCGRSRPSGELVANTTPLLVEDLEALRRHVGERDEQWACVLGGSWGSTLALAYAQTYPHAARSIVLRGVCAMRRREVEWLFSPRGGAAALAPRGWAEFARVVRDDALFPADETDADFRVLRAYGARLAGDDEKARDAAARGWMTWEARASSAMRGRDPAAQLPTANVWAEGCWTLDAPPESEPKRQQPPRNASLASAANATNHTAATADAPVSTAPTPAAKAPASTARRGCPPQPLLTSHYSLHGAFMEDGAVLRRDALDRIRHIPAIAVQGASDCICPPTTAYELHAGWPEMQLRLVQGAGHSQYDPDITHHLLEATDACIALSRRSDTDYLASLSRSPRTPLLDR